MTDDEIKHMMSNSDGLFDVAEKLIDEVVRYEPDREKVLNERFATVFDYLLAGMRDQIANNPLDYAKLTQFQEFCDDLSHHVKRIRAWRASSKGVLRGH